jgi:hypothetical protein
MPGIFRQYTTDEVNTLHLNSDKDAGAGALHHTLGINPSQASPGNHTHNGRDSKRIQTGSLTTVSVPYTPVFSGTGLTFTGTPATGTYIKIGNLIHFRIKVVCTTVTNFGTGQYHLTLPFPPVTDYVFRDGGFHDFSTGNHHAISADSEPGTNVISLWHPGSSAKDIFFDHNTPLIIQTQDYFYVSGTYEAAV